jgi:hypothetical protein
MERKVNGKRNGSSFIIKYPNALPTTLGEKASDRLTTFAGS